MTSWTLDDGTRIERNGGAVRVFGNSRIALAARNDIAAHARGAEVPVDVGPRPGGWVLLDPANVWLVDRWVRELAWQNDRVGVESDYVADDNDAPSAAQRILERPPRTVPPDAVF